MSMTFAKGDKAWGHCDRCGFRYLLKELKREEHTKVKVCPTCFDPVPDQSWPPHPSPRDAVSLQDPRPDRDDATTLYDDDGDGLTQLKDVISMTHGDT